MKLSMFIAPSRRLNRWIHDSGFRDTIAVRSTASPLTLLQAFEDVTLHEMPLARFLGMLRYLPALFTRGDAARRVQLDEKRPFLEGLTHVAGRRLLEAVVRRAERPSEAARIRARSSARDSPPPKP